MGWLQSIALYEHFAPQSTGTQHLCHELCKASSVPEPNVGAVHNDDELDLGVGDIAEDLLVFCGVESPQEQVSAHHTILF